MSNVDDKLARDLRLYGECFWKLVDGKKVRVEPGNVRYINGEPMEVGGEKVSSATRTSGEGAAS